MEAQRESAALLQLQDFCFPQKSFAEIVPRKALLKKASEVLQKYGFTNTWCEKDGCDSPTVVLICTDIFERRAIFQMYKTGLATLDLLSYPAGMQAENNDVRKNPWGDFQNSKPKTSILKAINTELRAVFNVDSLDGGLNVPGMRVQPVLQRNRYPSMYATTCTDRLIEYDMEDCLYNVHSDFQRIHIFKSTNFGNMLYLDGFQNMAESDLIYTQTILNIANEDYSEKEVLILGGGDGGILNELVKLERPPKFVTMVEIDKMVIEGCKKYMRSVCGDVFDKMSGDRYKVIRGDCFEHMDKCIADGTKFDYVVCDLTDAPIGDDAAGDDSTALLDLHADSTWDLLRRALFGAVKVVRLKGKILTHANGLCATKALQRYEQLLKSLPVPVEFVQDRAFVPSFLEYWMFYRITRL